MHKGKCFNCGKTKNVRGYVHSDLFVERLVLRMVSEATYGDWVNLCYDCAADYFRTIEKASSSWRSNAREKAATKWLSKMDAAKNAKAYLDPDEEDIETLTPHAEQASQAMLDSISKRLWQNEPASPGASLITRGVQTRSEETEETEEDIETPAVDQATVNQAWDRIETHLDQIADKKIQHAKKLQEQFVQMAAKIKEKESHA